MSISRKALAVLSLALAIALVAGLSVAGALDRAPARATVKTAGTETFKPGHFVSDTKHFNPLTIRVRSGGRVTWVHADQNNEPHTITISTRGDLPRSFDDPCKPCHIASGHLKDPSDPSKGLKTKRLNRGPAGLDEEGDSLALLPHQKISSIVSASAGTTLYYVCAIHPWMQGKIIVGQ
jgi:plastocyanin